MKTTVDNVQMIGTVFLPIDIKNKKILISKRSMNKKSETSAFPNNVLE